MRRFSFTTASDDPSQVVKVKVERTADITGLLTSYRVEAMIHDRETSRVLSKNLDDVPAVTSPLGVIAMIFAHWPELNLEFGKMPHPDPEEELRRRITAT